MGAAWSQSSDREWVDEAARSLLGPLGLLLLQGGGIACYAEPCVSYGQNVRLSVYPSVRPSHAGTESKRRKLGSRDLHRRIAQGL